MNKEYEIAIEKLLERKLPYKEVLELLNTLLANKEINAFLDLYFAALSFGFSILKKEYKVEDLIINEIYSKFYCYFNTKEKYKDRLNALYEVVELIKKKDIDNKILIEVCRNECSRLVAVNIKHFDLKLKIDDYFGYKK